MPSIRPVANDYTQQRAATAGDPRLHVYGGSSLHGVLNAALSRRSGGERGPERTREDQAEVRGVGSSEIQIEMEMEVETKPPSWNVSTKAGSYIR